jgi:superfamily II DNA/RNA helicase
MSFKKFGFSSLLLKAIKEQSYKELTKIQENVIPLVLDHLDIMARAQTGSGKTASFVLPILHKFSNKTILKKAKVTTLILTPTRDLTLQVAKSIEIFSKYFEHKPKVVAIIGGQSIGNQLLQIQKGCDMIVATSGRLLDILDKKQLDLSYVEHFVLDEADKMLDLGFAQELDQILKALPTKRQNLLFSATYPPKMLSIATRISTVAKKVLIKDETPTVQNINQRVIAVNAEKRSPLLQELLRTNRWKKVLVFMKSKRATDNLSVKFRKFGFLTQSFHGDLDQEERNLTLDEFKSGEIEILFSTDIASRGLHIDDIDCVVNFDLPRASEDYIHRIGRTARAGKNGTSITFIGLDDFEHFKLIEKRCNLNIHKEQIKDFELIGIPTIKQKGKAPIKGKRRSKKDKLREQGLLK